MDSIRYNADRDAIALRGQRQLPAASATRRARAFTLLEMTLVAAIVIILAAVAVPRFGSALAHYRLEAAARRVAADLRLARRSARFASAARRVKFEVGDDEYTLPDMADIDHSDDTYTVSLAGEPYRADIISADFNGSPNVSFDGYGRPDNGGSVVIQIGARQRTITVDADTGEASVQ